MGEATIRVAIVADRGSADLCVFRVTSMGLAMGDAFWFITSDRGSATSLAYFCSEGMAQLRVHFVATRGEAGWIVPRHRLSGRL